MDAVAQEYDQAFQLAKEQAAIDGVFPDDLMKQWYAAAWDLCAAMVGFVYPPREIEEMIVIRPRDGWFRLRYKPSSEVKLFEGATLVATLPPTLERSACDPALCCFCWLKARYWVGDETCHISPRFLQAVARLFAYMAQNRGDAEMDEHVLKKSGAFAFLAPDVTYVL